MLQLLSRRIVFILVVCLCIALFIHLGMRMVRNSEIREPNYDLVTQTRLAWEDTRRYLRGALQGDLGSIRVGPQTAPISQVLKESYVNSMGLLLVALIAAVLIGLPLGLLASAVKRRNLNLIILTVTILGISAPAFFVSLLLRQGELYYVRVFGHPLVSIAGFGWDYKHMLLPVIVLAARPLAYLTRASFISMNSVMEEDYIRTAYAKGLSSGRTVGGHALPNVAVPILTAIGVSLRFALVALPVVEFFFVWPGLGLRMLEAIDARQTAVVVTLALTLGLTFLILNLLLDLAYWLVDPRVRENT
ncbi:MAG: ABC transporter permease [Chloroflexota bacterium]|jgi:ABC-type dipeptide/oligopeptide/nickel transport system permease component